MKRQLILATASAAALLWAGAAFADCTGTGQNATCTETETSAPEQFQQSVIEKVTTTTEHFAGPSCSSGNTGTGQCGSTGIEVDNTYTNTKTGKVIGKK